MNLMNKIQRINSGAKPRVLDLFSGCGGISLGFYSAGFEIVGAVEIDSAAAKSHALNFHRDNSPNLFDIHAEPKDITITEPEDLLAKSGLLGKVDEQIDIIVGGPPCQAFARVGRAKLREVAEHPEAFLLDPRSNLYLRYLEYVRVLKPVALLMENVPDILNYGGHNIAHEVCEVLEDLGYTVKYSILNAVYYGVPEMRERMFLVAFHHKIKPNNWFPEPSHWVDLPQGYHGSRQVALQTVRRDLFETDKYFIEPPEPHQKFLLPAITAEQALSDLPQINDDSLQKKIKGARHFKELVYYDSPAVTNYQKLMREWPGFESFFGVYDHVIRYLPRDYKIFARMAAGDQYPEAHQLAIKMFNERLKEIERKEGIVCAQNSLRYKHEWKKFVPPYDPGKFPNKWRKMEADKPARTLMAHLGKDSYSHIHYDSKQARTISVREAARLQSFPDGFVFQGPMNPAFKQIGNAVPPLMAKAMAMIILKQIERFNLDAEETCSQTAVSV